MSGEQARTWYALTALGRTLDGLLAAVRAWAEANMPVVRDARRRGSAG